MSKIIKIFAAYAIISGIAMVVLWGILFLTGFSADKMSHTPVAFWGLIAAESITATALVCGGIGILKSKFWGNSLTFTAMGMLLYAVVFASGAFAQQKNILLSSFFVLIFCATAVILLMNLFRK
ncbi:MAG TPA: hypothetical protein VLX68_12730 [Chitinivibrionales bacterium]|nr:hypothetical protein [Chitinivibrionales bacterium]